jgi:hypothetical protein
MDPRIVLTQGVIHSVNEFFRENRSVILDSLESAKTNPIYATIGTFPIKVKFEFILWVAHGASRAINAIRENYGFTLYDSDYLNAHVELMLDEIKYKRRWILSMKSGVPRKIIRDRQAIRQIVWDIVNTLLTPDELEFFSNRCDAQKTLALQNVLLDIVAVSTNTHI